MTEYRKGDRCRRLDNRVEHFDCHTYADGVVTDVHTGKVEPVATPTRSDYPTEGADGTPHLTYYVDDVSFVWSGNIERPIQVCPGGYGEPVVDTIWPDNPDQLRGLWPDPLRWFRDACDDWLRGDLSDTHLASGRSDR